MRFWVFFLLVGAGCKTENLAQKAPLQVASSEKGLPPAPPIRPVLGLPPVPESPSNPLTPEKAELGRWLFFDKRMSKDGSMACEGCHHIPLAYTSGKALDAKVGGALNKRNAPTMKNLGYHTLYYWDGRMPTLEAVSNAAWKGQLGADPATVAATLGNIPAYRAQFERALGEGPTAENVPLALASFFRSLRTGNSAYDRFMAGDTRALSAKAQEGYRVFLKANCNVCHVPPLFSDFDFHRIGWGKGDAGRKDATQREDDEGKFKTPSLRDVALTAPYFHDGQAQTLDEAIDFMARGGGAEPGSSPKWRPANLTAAEKAQLRAFLESLTGETGPEEAPALP